MILMSSLKNVNTLRNVNKKKSHRLNSNTNHKLIDSQNRVLYCHANESGYIQTQHKNY